MSHLALTSSDHGRVPAFAISSDVRMNVVAAVEPLPVIAARSSGLHLLSEDLIAPTTFVPSCREPMDVDELLPVVGASTASLIGLLKNFSACEETLLIAGPTGAGKSRLARWCHARSQRAGGPFEVLDLMSVPAEMQMAAITGWKRGAFTGAVNDSLGALARAACGTLFIDEIDKLSLATQAGFLQFLEERTYRPLGDGGAARSANVRVIVGTNADLQACVRAGTFREDLFYRIHVLPVTLPALDERKDEIPSWVRYMVQRRHCETGGGAPVDIAADAIDLLCASTWPGNLRQLDNVVRRAYALACVINSRIPVIDRERVSMALGFEHRVCSTGEIPLTEALRRCAGRLVQVAREMGALPMDVLDGFRGLVVQAALEQTGSREQTAILLGQDEAIANRNHHRMLRRELGRARLLLHTLGDDSDVPDLR
jgi:DNA-binding NtrC family response regulator